MKNVDINNFIKKYNEEYNFLYSANDCVAGFDEAVKAFDDFSKNHKDFISEFVKRTGDFISSDREAAAFMFTLDLMV